MVNNSAIAFIVVLGQKLVLFTALSLSVKDFERLHVSVFGLLSLMFNSLDKSRKKQKHTTFQNYLALSKAVEGLGTI